MIKRDREYRVVENISLICFAIGLIIACITRFIPFIYIYQSYQFLFHLG